MTKHLDDYFPWESFRRLRMTRSLKLVVITANLVIVAYILRSIPWQGIAFTPSHFRFNIYQTIAITANQGHLPVLSQSPSVANMRISNLDAWPSLVYHPMLWSVLGIETENMRYAISQWVISAPLVAGSATLLVARRFDSTPWKCILAFLLPFFAGQLFFSNTLTGIDQLGHGGSLFIWAIVSIVLIEQSHTPRRWSVITILMSTLTLAWRHTAGMVLFISFSVLFLIVSVLPLRRKRQIRITILAIISIHLLHSAIVFGFYTSIIGSAFTWLLTFSGSLDRPSSSTNVPGPTNVSFQLSDFLSFVDRIVILTIIGVLWAASLYQLYTLRQRNETANQADRFILVLAACSLGILPAAVSFYVYKGLGGVVYRTMQYMTLFGFLAIPTLWVYFERQLHKTIFGRLHLSSLVVVFAILLMVISPVAVIATGTNLGNSNYLTYKEAAATNTLSNIIPQEDRIAGSYHISPPLAASHEKVVWVGFQRFSLSEIERVLKGIYYSPTAQSFPQSITLLEDEYGTVNILILSNRASGPIGVQSRAQRFSTAPVDYIGRYRKIPAANKIYSNGQVSAFRL